MSEVIMMDNTRSLVKAILIVQEMFMYKNKIQTVLLKRLLIVYSLFLFFFLLMYINSII